MRRLVLSITLLSAALVCPYACSKDAPAPTPKQRETAAAVQDDAAPPATTPPVASATDASATAPTPAPDVGPASPAPKDTGAAQPAIADAEPQQDAEEVEEEDADPARFDTGPLPAMADVGGSAAAALALPDESAPFAPLVRGLPKTLKYRANGHEFACYLEDAGVPGSEVDFKVSCEPRRPRAPWGCAAESYFRMPESRPAHRFWRTTGCYAARPDGLWYFRSCPSEAADIVARKGGVRLLSASMLERATRTKPAHEELEDGSNYRSTFRLGDQQHDVVCNSREAYGMSKQTGRAHCFSPRYAYVSAAASHMEPVGAPDAAVCQDDSALVAVEPGRVAPRACAQNDRVIGQWRVTTQVTRQGDKKLDQPGNGATYELTITGDPACKLTAAFARTGVGRKTFEPAKVRRGSTTLRKGCEGEFLGRGCHLARVELAAAGGTAQTMTFYLVFGSDRLTGLWHYSGESWTSSAYFGALIGKRGATAAVPFSSKQLPAPMWCAAQHCQADGTKLECGDMGSEYETCVEPQ